MLLFALWACTEEPSVAQQKINSPNNGVQPAGRQGDLEQSQEEMELSFELLGCSSGFRSGADKGDLACVQSGKGASLVSMQIALPPAESNNGVSQLLVMQTEVTQGFYQQVMQKNPVQDCEQKLNKAQPDPGQPLYCISFADAAAFANTLSEKVGLRTCYTLEGEKIALTEGLKCSGYRLPTLIEWQLISGNIEESQMKEHAWYADNSQEQTHIVAKKKIGPNNLYDIFGNVSEWIWKDDQGGPFAETLSGEKRLSLGGSAGDVYTNLQLEAGRQLSYKSIDEGTGFRLIRHSKRTC